MAGEQVTLPIRQAEFIRQMIATHRFSDFSEVVRAGIPLLEEPIAQKERQKDALRVILDDAFASGLSDRAPQQIWDATEARHLARNT